MDSQTPNRSRATRTSAGSLGRTGESRMAQPGATGRWRRKVVTYGYGEMRRCQAAHASTSARELNHWTETARYSVTRYRPRNSSTKSSRLHRLLRGGTNSTAKWRQRPGSVAMKCGTHQNAWLRRTAMGCSANARHQNHIATSQQFSRSRFRNHGRLRRGVSADVAIVRPIDGARGPAYRDDSPPARDASRTQLRCG